MCDAGDNGQDYLSVHQQHIYHLHMEMGVVWYRLCEGILFFLLAITDLLGKNSFCDCKIAKGRVEGKCLEVEGERPSRTLLTLKSQCSHGD